MNVAFRHTLADHQKVRIFDPDEIKNLVRLYQKGNSDFRTGKGKIEVITEDSLATPRDMVMNFANAHHPGGGYKSGSSAQEECLCRQSTLYASIGSPAASEMYRYNCDSGDPFGSDYLLFSPCVEVFRNRDLTFLEKPFTTSVITVPALNRKGTAAREKEEDVENVFIRRIRNLLCVAAFENKKTLTLGAWGCGAFGNNAHMAAMAFRKVLEDEGWIRYFDLVCFSIPNGENYRIFKEVIEGNISCNAVGARPLC